ncbi:hypothetical protein HYH02_014470 [Chlamydomonas schloesseri]|uniref:Uncharacterized protein n=1 Tax=Chlamydomonas schloesseri TaxID=2026947 RepID=A0A835SJD1_9CHLO|nr:hypothetical protein HYH02_014470 [Chlamydomonas schloesseri]|eukprot:KAG2428079.1 hypothetical protein HYH02_014470 [Chlamydomonas schloesseri]
MQVLDHLHNLRGKAIEPLFLDFRSSLQLNLSAQHKPLVEGCQNFFDLNNLFTSLRGGSAAYEDLLKASEPFCEKYDLVMEFWVQFTALMDLIYMRNREVHCSVDDSANFISSVCDQPEAFPELDQAWAMIEALANYGSKHASALDAAAEAQRQAAAKVTAKFKQRRQQKNQHKL